MGCSDSFALSSGLLTHLDSLGIKSLSQIVSEGQSSIWGQAWKLEDEVGIDPIWREQWQQFIQELRRSNVRLSDKPDSLVWAHSETGSYSPKAGYYFLMKKKGWDPPVWWAKPLFKLKCPKKARIFFWCVLKNKIPSWDILQARFKQGPGRCPLCFVASETIPHLFLECPFTKQVWEETRKILNSRLRWEGENVINAWEYWWHHHVEGNLRNLSLIIFWGIWLARNRNIFREKSSPAELIAILFLLPSHSSP